MTAYVIPPVNAEAVRSGASRFGITESMLVFSSVPETPPPAYDAGVSYIEGAEVSQGVVGKEIKVWRSKQAGNLNHPLVEGAWWTYAGSTYSLWDPARNWAEGDMVIRAAGVHQVYKAVAGGVDATLPENDASGVHWTSFGATNRWLMFDMLAGQPTRAPGPIKLILAPGAVSALGMIGVSEGASTFSMTAYGNPVWGPEVVNLDTTVISSWEDYFFEPFAPLGNIVRLDLPSYAEGLITVDIDAGETFSLQWLVLGSWTDIGETKKGPRVRDRSGVQVKRNKFNDIEAIEVNGLITEINQTMWIEKAKLLKARRALRIACACPSIVMGLHDSTDEYAELLTQLGIVTDCDIDAAEVPEALINLQTESVLS